MIGEYARLSAAAGGFDRSDAQLRRALLKLDARGFAQLSKACETLLERVAKIEADAAKRLGADPHGEDVIETGLGVMLFEAARLSSEPAGGPRDGPREEPPPPAARPQAVECPGDGVGRRRGRHRGMRAGAPCKVHGHRSECLISGPGGSLSGN